MQLTVSWKTWFHSKDLSLRLWLSFTLKLQTCNSLKHDANVGGRIDNKI